jgi:AcrR family transcriptional regulator
LLLRLAIKKLAAVGYEAMTLEDVAREAGLTRAAVYRYFASKQELARTAILANLPTFDMVEGYFRQYAQESPTLGGQVSALVRACLRTAAERPEASRYYYALGRVVELEDDPNVARIFRSWSMFVRNKLVQIVSSAIDRGELPGDFDSLYMVDAVAGLIWALAQGIATSPNGRVTRQIQLAADLFLRNPVWTDVSDPDNMRMLETFSDRAADRRDG